MKIAYRWFALFAFSLILSLHQAKAQEKGLLWKIDKPDITPSYLFATIHYDDPQVIRLISVIEKQFAQADSVVLEMKLTPEAMMKSLLGMYLTPEHTLDQFIAQADYERLVKRLKAQGVPEEVTKKLKPLAIMILLTTPRSKSGNFLDLMLYQKAQTSDKPVYGLETVEEQLAVFDLLSLEEQVSLLKESLTELDDMPKLFEKMLRLYLQRDLAALLKLSQKYMQMGEHEALMQKFMHKLIDERNQRMFERMQMRLAAGNTFIAVGALHLPGEKGLLNLLKQAGYQVSVIY